MTLDPQIRYPVTEAGQSTHIKTNSLQSLTTNDYLQQIKKPDYSYHIHILLLKNKSDCLNKMLKTHFNKTKSIHLLTS